MIDNLRRHRQSGVSLIEAVVALGVMAFGMVGMVGLQGTLRGNADIAKQRSEAVRLAQDRIEQAQTFSVIDPVSGASPPPRSFAGIASVAQELVTPLGAGTTYRVTQDVTTNAGAVTNKTVVVTVDWPDRAGVDQRVRLSALITAVSPVVQGTLALSGANSPVQLRSGRHVSIPIGAVDISNGRSSYTPAGAPAGVVWIFNNLTGFICTAGTCATPLDFNARRLAGYVRFATLGAPLAGAGIDPPGSLIGNLGVSVTQTSPVAVTVPCYTRDDLVNQAMSYECAISIPSGSTWGGRASVQGLPLATSIGDASALRYRVCRYTTVRDQAIAPTEISNQNHPLDYVGVTRSLDNQNYLVIRAGSGSVAYDCPEGLPLPSAPPDPSLPPPAGRTWRHQPAV